MSATNELRKRPAQSSLPMRFVSAATMGVTALLGLAALLHDKQLAVIGIGVLLALIPCLLLLAAWMWRRRAAIAPALAAKSRYQSAILFWGALYIAIMLPIIWIGDVYMSWPYWARALVALAPVVPIAGTVAALWRYLGNESDEFQRMLMTRAVLLAMGAAFIFLTGWGFLQKFGAAPEFPLYAAMAPFWVAFTIVNPIVRWTYR